MDQTRDQSAPEKPVSSGDDAGEEEDVGIRTRAYPLIQLLKAARRRKAAVMWEYEDSKIV